MTATTARETIKLAAQACGWTLWVAEPDGDTFTRGDAFAFVIYTARGTVHRAAVTAPTKQSILPYESDKRARVLAWFAEPEASAVVLESPATPGADESENGSPVIPGAVDGTSPVTPGANVHHESPATAGARGLDPARTVKVEFQLTDGYTTAVDTVDVPVNVADYPAWIKAAEGLASADDVVVSIRDAEIDMDEVARLVRDACGIGCCVSMTGGNTATICAEPEHVNSDGDARQAAIAGPGSYSWDPTQPSTGTASDFYVGPDDGGDAIVASVADLGAFSAAEIATLIVAQATRGDVAKPLSSDELDSLGFVARRGRPATATPFAYAAAIMPMIKADVAAGRIPAEVAGFSALHDHVDANGYMIDADVPWDQNLRADLRLLFTNIVSGIVDHAIAAGALVGTAVALDTFDLMSPAGADVSRAVRDQSPSGAKSPAGAGHACPTCGQGVAR